MASEDALLTALFAIRVAFSAILLATSLSFLTVKNSTRLSSDSSITSVVVQVTTPRRSLILSILSLVALTYFLDGFGLVLHSVLRKHWQGTPSEGSWWLSQWSGIEVEAVSGLLASGLLAIFGVWKETQGVPAWTMRRPRFWAVAAVVGTIVEVALIFSTVHFYRRPIGIPERPPSFKYVDLLHALFPVLRLLILLPLYPVLAYPRVSYAAAAEAGRVEADAASVAPSEDTGLVITVEEGNLTGQGIAPRHQPTYGTFRSERSFATSTRSHTPVPSDGQEATAFMKKTAAAAAKNHSENAKPEHLSFREMCKRLRRLTPFLWPKGSIKLHVLATLCIIVLLLGRVVNAAVPLVLGQLVDIFEKQFGSEPPPVVQSFWPYLLLYVALRFLQGSGGLAALRDFLWAPVTQYSDREMSQMAFTHLLSLSLSFHLRRKTGEVLRILDRGAAINRIFELLLFNICPVFIDMFVAVGIFIWKFDWVLGFLVAFVMFAYVGASITLTSWRTRIRRQMNDKDIITRGIHTDCLLNYETVKYFVGENFEAERYASAIRDYQSMEYRVIASLNLLNLVQNLLMSIGFLVGGIIVALRVSQRVSTPSEFVVFIVYLGQLYGPLNRLGSVYRQINTSLVDAERLLKLLDEPHEVSDKPGAPDLIVNDGEIEFDNVSFSYDGRRTALRGVSFKVPKGSSVALVGESGSGKSTVLRLLYRFYDLKEGEGRILIDGQDIRDVTQISLRKAIGVVPQDSVLFNASIAYNIGYGKFGASQEEIESAAAAAHMHERILSFPDGYDTKVGERGVRLSGGEKQRVAIARTLLKDPPVLLLDEATSALDTSTEKDIQKALNNLMHGRSSLSIAHRLSTIASADLILVLKDGQIVEQGTHRELLEKDGVFAAMWADQIRAEEPELAPLESVKQEAIGYSAELDTIADSQPPTGDVVELAPEPVPESEPITQVEDRPAQDVTVPSDTEVEGKVDAAEGVPADMPVTAVGADREDAAAPSAPPAGPVASSSDAPVAFPSDAPVAFPSAPISFPTSEQPPETESSAAPPTPGVTFDNSVSHPARSETPDSNAEPRRKRTASQNFQRFARRVSLVGKRTSSGVPSGSSSQPATPHKDEVKPASAKETSAISDDASGPAEDSATASPAASLAEGKKLPRKEKLKKRFSMGGGKKDSA